MTLENISHTVGPQDNLLDQEPDDVIRDYTKHTLGIGLITRHYDNLHYLFI